MVILIPILIKAKRLFMREYGSVDRLMASALILLPLFPPVRLKECNMKFFNELLTADELQLIGRKNSYNCHLPIK